MCFIAVIAAGALLAGIYAGRRLYMRFFPPAARHEPVIEREQEAYRKAAALIGQRAQIVWSSNRGGNHDLYALDLPEGVLRKLTDAKPVDFYPRYSPDGSRIAFLRSRRDWVSFRDSENWDALIMERGGEEARTIGEGVYHPSWWPDGHSVVYTRTGGLYRYYLKEEREERLADGSLDTASVWFGMPSVSPAGDTIALTVRKGWQGVGVLDVPGGTLRRIDGADSCQIAWHTDGSSLIWVARGGRGRNRFLHLPAGSSRPSVLLDLPGDYSHEYFPRVSNDGAFLIFAASAEGHEHDRADYEIFLWRIGTPAAQAIRLTYHDGNDQWPDIWIEPE